MPSIQQLREEVSTIRGEMKAVFDAYPDLNIPEAEAKKIPEMNAQLDKKVAELEAAEALQGIKSRVENMRAPEIVTNPGQKGDSGKPAMKSVADILRADAGYKSFIERGTKGSISIEIPEAESKTLMTLTTINAQAERAPGIYTSIQDRTTITDLVPSRPTTANTLTYYEETTFTNAAASVAEGDAKPEAALAFTERTDNVRKIAVWIPATTEMLEDVDGIEAYVTGRLVFMLEREKEDQILSANGTAPNISGYLDRSIQTQAKGADPVPDAILKAITKVEVGGDAEPTGIIMHPNDWQAIRLLTTADGIYLWGSPSEAGMSRIWGLPVRRTSLIAENTALVGAFSPHSMIRPKGGITVTLSTEHSTYFVENKVAILAEMRLALQVFRPYAFCSVTGI